MKKSSAGSRHPVRRKKTRAEQRTQTGTTQSDVARQFVPVVILPSPKQGEILPPQKSGMVDVGGGFLFNLSNPHLVVVDAAKWTEIDGGVVTRVQMISLKIK